MKIEGNLLSHLTAQLNNYLSDTKLRNVVEDILIDYSNELTDKQKLYLVNLLKDKFISDKEQFAVFLKTLSQLPNTSRTLIEKQLTNDKLHNYSLV